MKRRVWRRGIVVIALAVVAASLTLAAPASAAPKPTPGGGHISIKKGDHLKNGTIAPAAVSCTGTFTPVPQHSTSGGTYGTVHWGGHLNCVGTPGNGHFAEYLYTVVGTGDNEHQVLEDSNGWSGITGSDGTSWYTACYLRTSTRWIASLSATYNGNPYTPAKIWTSVYSLPCGADL
jgi:hypothetical protein